MLKIASITGNQNLAYKTSVADVTAIVTYHICYSCTTQIEHLDDKVCPLHLYIAILPAHFEPNYYSVSSCFCYSLETRLFIPCFVSQLCSPKLQNKIWNGKPGFKATLVVLWNTSVLPFTSKMIHHCGVSLSE